MGAARSRAVIAVSTVVIAASVASWPQQSSATTWVGSATTRYVAPNGNDHANDCQTQAAPCRTIRHALARAGQGNTISLATGKYREHGLTINTSVTISGQGAPSTLVSGGGVGAVFVVPSGVTVTMTGITVTDGVTSDHGGAITNSGTLTLTHDRFTDNSATDPGGAITNYTTIVSLVDDVFAHNHSGSGGGAIRNFGTIGTASRDIFRSNSGDGAGAVYNEGDIGTLTNSTFARNTDDDEAGALVNDGTIGDLSEDTFSHNTSEGGIGGALENIFGTITSLTNDTFAGNTAVGELSQGGAIEQDFGTITFMADDTIIDNRAAIGGGLDNENGVVGSIGGVILAGNRGKQGPNCYFFDAAGGSMTDTGYNLLGDTANTCGFSAAAHDLIDIQPDLRPLGRYGGHTKTAPPTAGSPVVDAGGQAPCPTAVDQIGTARPVGPACDIGSVEYDASEAR